ncbi:MAG: ribosome biogenesis GTPase YlqF [Acholeplasmataceae bacterium]|nr:ribosome biogenesis GTPase YlqF [Acholeplasmataceae bacterium]MDD4468442.1 ribosome biogenesis GTPase YlqF [Acholeplasmataceae bacterium]MDY0316366.1 ribosome biogenesis GTPase YlqF [Acholeplasmatales bacterium]
MAKTKKEVKEAIKKVDIVYLLLDSRAPISSLNPDLESIKGNKPTLYLFNKSSLADLTTLKEVIRSEKMEDYIIIDALKRTNLIQIKVKTLEMLTPIIEKKKAKGYQKVSVKAMIVGIPNVGKSTLINAITNKKIAGTNPKPGFTKQLHWVYLDDDIHLLDTPGVLWPKFENEQVGYHLALSGAIKETLLPNEKLAYYAAEFMEKYYPNRLKEFYKVEFTDTITFFNHLAIKRGYLLEQGKPNLEQSFLTLLDDLKKGLLGGVCFDRPI